MTYRKKLIEVALPLEAINEESSHEKAISQGHPSTLHLWWARRPLAACRAVIWSSLVDDPSEYMPDEESANLERERLFTILEKLVKWENSNNEAVLEAAKLEIARSVARNLGCEMPVGRKAIHDFLENYAPPVLDPFAGGGSIPLEAQRLGMRAFARDINPVPVLINKALIEIPQKFNGMPPVHPPKEGQRQESLLNKKWKGVEGLAEDIRYYGQWIRDEAEKRIGYLYPKVKLSAEIINDRQDLKQQGYKPDDELVVIAWLWTRTVKCPNPACGIQMPLLNSFTVCTKPGKETFIQPIITDKKFTYKVIFNKSSLPATPKIGRGIQFSCLACGQIAKEEYIKGYGLADSATYQLVSIVAEGKRGRLYFSPDINHEDIARDIKLEWSPNIELSTHPQYMAPPRYKLNTFADLFTKRQIKALDVLSDLVGEVYHVILSDAKKKELGTKYQNLDEYAQAVCIYLGMNVGRQANRMSTLCFWDPGGEKIQQVFSRQAYTMNWNFPETNPFSTSSGNFLGQLEYLTKVLESLPTESIIGNVEQMDAVKDDYPKEIMISTDPPYYDNVPYADLSDFFYVWLRKSLSKVYPPLFNTMLVPKTDELVADHQRHGGKENANVFFENGLHKVFNNARNSVKNGYPTTVFYAYKQAETGKSDSEEKVTASTGWETMLESLLNAGFSINATWPMRTESTSNIKKYLNSLASSIVLVCRPRLASAERSTRRDFRTILKRELPLALHTLQQGNIAPVDLAQAAVGPGMAIFSRYKTVLEADGSPMHVRAALELINQALDEYLAEQEGEYDSDTRWALAWFEQYGHDQGPYGVAETLSKAKNTSVEGLSHAGFLEARAGKVRLLKRDELDKDWDPSKDKRLTAWEAAQYLIRTLDTEGEKGAGALLGELGATGETARDLAYRLYTICERKSWAQDALAYNMLVVAWPRIKEQSGKGPRQESLL